MSLFKNISFVLSAAFVSIIHAQDKANSFVFNNINQFTLKINSKNADKNISLNVLTFTPKSLENVPLLIMNHGLNAGLSYGPNNTTSPKPEPHFYMSKEFVAHGYVVANVMRRGRGGSEGERVADMCDLTKHAIEEANDIAAAVKFFVNRPEINKQQIILAGQSHGAVLMLALMAHHPEEAKFIKGAISFSGGVLHQTPECLWKRERLTVAYKNFGERIKTPILWLYTKKDELFSPDFYFDMHKAYTTAGGKADLVELVQSGNILLGGHNFIKWRTSTQTWWPPVEKYLQAIAMPTKRLYDIPQPYKITPSGYADINDLSKVPLTEEHKKYYSEFLTFPMPRVFVVNPMKGFSISINEGDSYDQAIKECIQKMGTGCKAYAIDDEVVYKP